MKPLYHKQRDKSFGEDLKGPAHIRFEKKIHLYPLVHPQITPENRRIVTKMENRAMLDL